MIRASEARAREFLDTAPTCDVCGTLVAARRMTRHASCEPNTLAGKVCVCDGRCTDKFWGDQNRCAPDCQPCRIMHGKRYVKP